MRIRYDQGVCVGNVHARFDDGGTNEDIDLSRKHFFPNAFEFVFVHFSMPDRYPCIGNGLLDARGNRIDRFHVIMQVKHLPAASQFASDGFLNDDRFLFEHIGLHGKTIHGSVVEDRNIADAAHRHIERTGDWRCRERQNVHTRRNLFEFFFLCHAESLFLVHDYESEVVKFHVVREQTVGADENIDLAAREPPQSLRLLTSRAETGEHIHVHCKTSHPTDHGLVVLKREQSGRNEDGDLFAAEYRFIGGAERDLGFAVADVAAEQTIHRNGTHHIGFDLIRRLYLTFGFGIFKRFLKGFLVSVIRREGVTRQAHPLGI